MRLCLTAANYWEMYIHSSFSVTMCIYNIKLWWSFTLSVMITSCSFIDCMGKNVSQGLSLTADWVTFTFTAVKCSIGPTNSLQCSFGSSVCVRTALRCHLGQNADVAVSDCSWNSWKRKVHTTIIGSRGSWPDSCGQSTARRVRVVETVPRILLFSSSLMFPLSAGLSCSFVDPSFFPFSGTLGLFWAESGQAEGKNLCVQFALHKLSLCPHQCQT